MERTQDSRKSRSAMLNNASEPIASDLKRISHRTSGPSFRTACKPAAQAMRKPIVTLYTALESDYDGSPSLLADHPVHALAPDLLTQTFSLCHKFAKWCARWHEKKSLAECKFGWFAPVQSRRESAIGCVSSSQLPLKWRLENFIISLCNVSSTGNGSYGWNGQNL